MTTVYEPSQHDWKAVEFKSHPSTLTRLPIRDVSWKRSSVIPSLNPQLQAYGIDPGVHFGLSWIGRDKRIYAVRASIVREEDTELSVLAHRVAAGIFGFTGVYSMLTVIEGAAYSKFHGQVDLEKIRSGMVTALHPYVKVVPPNRIRKLAFGSAKIAATSIWPLLDDHAADAVGCMLAAYQLRLEKLSSKE